MAVFRYGLRDHIDSGHKNGPREAMPVLSRAAVAAFASLVIASCAFATRPECQMQISVISLTDPAQPQSCHVRSSVAAVWDNFSTVQPNCFQVLASHHIVQLQESKREGAIDGLQELLHTIGYTLPANVAEKQYHETLETLGVTSDRVSQVAGSLVGLRSSFYPPDLTQRNQMAHDTLLASTDRVGWSVLKGWFYWSFADSGVEPSLQAAIDRNLAAVRLSKQCAEALSDLNEALYCFQLDYERLSIALRETISSISTFLVDTEPEYEDDGDETRSASWRSKDQIRLADLCLDLLKLYGVGEGEGYHRCKAGPRVVS